MVVSLFKGKTGRRRDAMGWKKLSTEKLTVFAAINLFFTLILSVVSLIPSV